MSISSVNLLLQYNLCEYSVSVSSQNSFFLIMLRKGSVLLKGDREVLLDLDDAGDTHTTDCYGSLQNGSFIPPRCVSTVLLLSPSMFSQQSNEYKKKKRVLAHTAAISLLLCSSLHTSLTSLRCCSEPDIHWTALWCELLCITERKQTWLVVKRDFMARYDQARLFSISSFSTHYCKMEAFMMCNGTGFYGLTSLKGN